MAKLLFKSFPVGSAFGVPVRIQGLFVVFFGLCGAYLISQPGPAGGIAPVLILGAAFVCVVIHEFGHALVARRLGVRVIDVTVWPLGGMARMEDVPVSGGFEVAIAAAGPLVNLGLAGILVGVGWVLRRAGLGHTEVLELLAGINLLLAGFNLIPAFPLDGGRLLRGTLAMLIGDRRATRVAVSVGRLLALALAGVAAAHALHLLIVAAAFLFYAAGREALEHAEAD